jgi:uncharacterized membrane protein
MSRLQLRYLIISLFGGAAFAIAFQWFIGTIVTPDQQGGLTGAAFIAGWWGNLIAAITFGILAARKTIETLELDDPRMGKIAGTAMGLWVGLGVIIGNVLAILYLVVTARATVNPGLVVVFCLISAITAVVTATITGRETAQPHPEEEA